MAVAEIGYVPKWPNSKRKTQFWPFSAELKITIIFEPLWLVMVMVIESLWLVMVMVT